MTQKLLKDSEINVQNIRSQFYEVEAEIAGLIKDVETFNDADTKNLLRLDRELSHWKERRELLLQKMTAEQRSLVMDDFDEIPKVFDRIIEIVKLQEAAQ
jgi:hypothetical protein